ncbi:lytic transglycosylase domain-containing protein [Sphingosinicella terrae]|uniref:lytic transglycosylase domain-containing protein n=1 Tax=Sphingosinicella terrae TaxID=2172047 RepID=UPI000E0DB672|nr:lytic transglycosylase domain-containing protein [Sphingosinicella terrae]
MIDRAQLEHLRPAQRAEIIYRQAQSELAQSLWRAAVGDGDRDAASARAGTGGGIATGFGLDELLTLIGRGTDAVPTGSIPAAACGCNHGEAAAAPIAALAPQSAPLAPAPPASSRGEYAVGHVGLGPNARYGALIARAGERTGLPPSALAAIIDAEAARGAGGVWNSHSRNPRSSAAGLGQFISSTWIGEAERGGTWLNGEASRRGWLGADGRVEPSARSSLLAMRYDPEASIEAIADYADHNLARLRRGGVDFGDNVERIARGAYLAHHLGPGDAMRFLARGGLDDGRAARLLAAQVGPSGASRRVAAAAGDASEAHRQWLLSYLDRRIRPDRFTAQL